MTDNKDTCRICHAPFHPYDMGEKNGYRLTACKTCGSVVADPWPSGAELEQFFGDIQPEIVHLPNPAGEIAYWKKWITKAIPQTAGKRFLDITCRQGYITMAAKELGFQAKGIEPYDFFVSFAKNKYDSHLFEHITVQDYAARGEQADVIFSVESFCEQTDPESYMAALAKILAPGGVLYIQEPDGNSFHLPRTFTKWNFVDPPINFLYLSEKGMKALLHRHGFKIQRRFFTWGPLMRFIAVRQ